MRKVVRLTESDLVRIVKRVIKEQTSGSKNVDCLLKSGFTRETIGGPMTRQIVYQKNVNGVLYQIGVTGNDTLDNKVTIVRSNRSDICSSWACDDSSNLGIKFEGCIVKPKGYM
jgi:hypothetical protein